MSTPAVVPQTDPWLDDEFTRVQHDDERQSLQSEIEALAAEQLAEQEAAAAAVAAEEEAAAAAEQPAPPVAPVELEPAGPEVMENPDGSSVTIEKTSRGWKATLDLGTPNATKEVFYGATKNEMWHQLAIAKLNATKKIREQNRQLKLGVPPKPQGPSSTAAPVTAPKPLTADQIVALKQKLEQNPDAAFAEWMQLRTGRSIEALVQQADAGAQALEQQILVDVCTAFVATHSDYHKSDENFSTIIAYVAKHKLGKILTEQNQDTILTDLVRSGEWTVSNLDEAYEDLRESGLLQVKPVAPKPVEPVRPVPAATTPAAAPAAPVAVAPTPTALPAAAPPRATRQPRVGFGIRPSETSNVPAASSTEPPSAQQLDQMSDAEIAQLMAAVRQATYSKR